MSEPEDFDIFDPDTFVTTSALAGKIGTIIDARAQKGYAEGQYPDATTFRATVVSEELARPRTGYYSCGAAEPAAVVDGKKVQAQFGPFLVGGAIDKQSTIADFLANLRASGFDMNLLKTKGFYALAGAKFVWKVVERRAGGKSTKGYDMPAEFLGFVDLTELAALSSKGTDDQAQAIEETTSAPAQSQEELAQLVSNALVEAVTEAGGELARGQVTIKVGQKLGTVNQAAKAAAFTMLLNEKFLASVPGIVADKKTVKLAQA